MTKRDVNVVEPASDKALLTAAADGVVEIIVVCVEVTAGGRVQSPQASAQRSVTNVLSLESEQAPLCTTMLHVMSPALLQQSRRSPSFRHFAAQIHRSFVIVLPVHLDSPYARFPALRLRV